MMHILRLLLEEYRSSAETLTAIDFISPEDFLLSEKTLMHLLDILEQTRIKLIHFFQQYPDSSRAPPDFSSYTVEETIRYIVNYAVSSSEHPGCGAYPLSVLYYEINGSYYKNARFLFGTGAQFCL